MTTRVPESTWRILVSVEGETEAGTSERPSDPRFELPEKGIAPVLARRIERATGRRGAALFGVQRESNPTSPTVAKRGPGGPLAGLQGRARKVAQFLYRCREAGHCAAIYLSDTDHPHTTEGLEEIRANVTAGIERARREGWVAPARPVLIGLIVGAAEALLLSSDGLVQQELGRTNPSWPDGKALHRGAALEKAWLEDAPIKAKDLWAYLARAAGRENFCNAYKKAELLAALDDGQLEKDCPLGFGRLLGELGLQAQACADREEPLAPGEKQQVDIAFQVDIPSSHDSGGR